MELTIPKSPFICTDADSAVAMDFSDISQSLEGDWDARMSLVPTPSNRCRSCPGHYIEEEEEEGEGQGGPCAVCRIEVGMCMETKGRGKGSLCMLCAE